MLILCFNVSSVLNVYKQGYNMVFCVKHSQQLYRWFVGFLCTLVGCLEASDVSLTVRLDDQSGGANVLGPVQVQFKGHWTYVCADAYNFTKEDEEAMCRHISNTSNHIGDRIIYRQNIYDNTYNLTRGHPGVHLRQCHNDAKNVLKCSIAPANGSCHLDNIISICCSKEVESATTECWYNGIDAITKNLCHPTTLPIEYAHAKVFEFTDDIISALAVRKGAWTATVLQLVNSGSMNSPDLVLDLPCLNRCLNNGTVARYIVVSVSRCVSLTQSDIAILSRSNDTRVYQVTENATTPAFCVSVDDEKTFRARSCTDYLPVLCAQHHCRPSVEWTCNGGECVPTNDYTEYTCNCPANKSGSNCDTDKLIRTPRLDTTIMPSRTPSTRRTLSYDNVTPKPVTCRGSRFHFLVEPLTPGKDDITVKIVISCAVTVVVVGVICVLVVCFCCYKLNGKRPCCQPGEPQRSNSLSNQTYGVQNCQMSTVVEDETYDLISDLNRDANDVTFDVKPALPQRQESKCQDLCVGDYSSPTDALLKSVDSGTSRDSTEYCIRTFDDRLAGDMQHNSCDNKPLSTTGQEMNRASMSGNLTTNTLRGSSVKARDNSRPKSDKIRHSILTGNESVAFNAKQSSVQICDKQSASDLKEWVSIGQNTLGESQCSDKHPNSTPLCREISEHSELVVRLPRIPVFGKNVVKSPSNGKSSSNAKSPQDNMDNSAGIETNPADSNQYFLLEKKTSDANKRVSTSRTDRQEFTLNCKQQPFAINDISAACNCVGADTNASNTADDSDYEDTTIIDTDSRKPAACKKASFTEHVCLRNIPDETLKKFGIKIVSEENMYSACSNFVRPHSYVNTTTYGNLNTKIPSIGNSYCKNNQGCRKGELERHHHGDQCEACSGNEYSKLSTVRQTDTSNPPDSVYNHTPGYRRMKEAVTSCNCRRYRHSV